MYTKIEAIIDGQKVEGEITHCSASEIIVKITQPYQDVSRGLQFPHFVRSHMRFDSNLGGKIAKDLLESIYHLCSFIFENMDSLTAQYLKIQKRIKYLEAKHVSDYVFKSRRLELRKLLKNGRVNNIEYQKRLAATRREHKKFELKKRLIWSVFFEDFPMIVPVGTRKDILRIFENNVRETNKESDRSEFTIIRNKMVMNKRVLLGNAYFIHPRGGQVIYVPHSHISLVISNPEKFNLNFDYIKTIYEKHGERIGLEGRARRKILLRLIDQGFIRIRKHKNLWKVNVKDLYKNAAAIFLYRWAKSIVGTTKDFDIEVIIEQRNGEVIKTELIKLASYKFAGRPKSWKQAMRYVPGPFLMIDEVESGPSLP